METPLLPVQAATNEDEVSVGLQTIRELHELWFFYPYEDM